MELDWSRSRWEVVQGVEERWLTGQSDCRDREGLGGEPSKQARADLGNAQGRVRGCQSAGGQAAGLLKGKGHRPSKKQV